MSTPAPDAPKSGSASKRYFFLWLVGLLMGIIATVMIIRMWPKHDPFPHALMHVQAHHMDALKENLKTNRCAATDTIPHLQTLRRTADDLEAAFPDLAKDDRFTKHASDFRKVLDASLASPPMNCEGVKQTLAMISDQCKACHDDFNK
ncbi:cytochrome c [Solilutibacter silvestris]|uniref:Cytochrome C n=1 Tax=Solilutibacter silvestris TaxID=1645665 RepID=A0A2K1PYC4_9GAMM|nr:cytochrome c [Lysobacter silvestris]PNS07780.1 Cytochrome C' [Lysobacter silvestris]